MPDSTVRRNGLIRCTDCRLTHDGFMRSVTHRADERFDFLPCLRSTGAEATSPSIRHRPRLSGIGAPYEDGNGDGDADLHEPLTSTR